MKYKLVHTSAYDYSRPVSHSYNQAHLIPRSTALQACLDFKFDIEPIADDFSTRKDVYGNQVAYFDIRLPHRRFVVTATSQVEVTQGHSWQALKDTGITVGETQNILQEAASTEARLNREFMLDSDFVFRNKSVRDFAASVLSKKLPIRLAVENLMDKIFKEFEYDPHFTDTATPLETVLDHKRGVCQDFAHLAIACLRSHGLAARYVSGYLETRPPPGEKKLVGSDASHAWFSVYVPGEGWLDFDPTNNLIPSGQHITLAWGRDYFDVTPLKGVLYGGGNHGVSVAVDVERMM